MKFLVFSCEPAGRGAGRVNAGFIAGMGAVTLALCGCVQQPTQPASASGAATAEQTLPVLRLGQAGSRLPQAGGYEHAPELRPDPDPASAARYGFNRRNASRAPEDAFSRPPAPIPPRAPERSASSGANSAFARTSATKQGAFPAAARPSPAPETSGILLGEGDVIAFSMFGQPDIATTAIVSAQGNVSLPLIGDTHVGGLTPSQAGDRIAQAYRAGNYFNNPQVNITLNKYRSQQISVLGEVNQPGRYPLETRTTVLDALAEAQGVKSTGSRTVTIIRKSADGSRRLRVNLDALVESSGRLQSTNLVAGDILYVPEAKLFYIYGEVRQPNAYAIKPGMRIVQAIALGGGLTDKGSNSRIEVRRKDANGNEVSISANLNDRVRPDDVIYVKERFF